MIITTEKAFDLLPSAVEVYEKLNVDKYIKDTRKKNKGRKVEAMDAGIDLFKFVLKNISKAKTEIFEIVAVVEDKTPQEIKEQSLPDTINSIKRIFGDEELIGLFKSAMQ